MVILLLDGKPTLGGSDETAGRQEGMRGWTVTEILDGVDENSEIVRLGGG
ncbi:MAG: hypothetical protein MI861_25730 [Pirellulales bacterium]|nr:hypothetical protein [Pirellulales bacterium]